MQKKRYKPYVYDVESYRNFFCCTFLPLNSDDLVTFVIDDKGSQANELIEFVKDTYLIGYNNKSYDNLIINYITKHPKVTASQIFDFGDGIIKSQNKDDLKSFFTTYKDYLFNDNYKYIDLMRMLFSKKLRVGLKELECSLNFKNVEELPYPVGATLDEIQKKRVIEYNINDCEAQREVALHSKKAIKLRAWTKQHFGADVYSLDGVNLGVKILEEKLAEKIGNRDFIKTRTDRKVIKVKDIIYPFIKFKSKGFNEVLDRYKKLTLKKYYSEEKKKDVWTKFKYEPVIKDYMFKYGTGGLHFETLNKAWFEDDEHSILSIDVASYYPKQVEEYPQYCKPEHLPDEFIDVYVDVKNERLKAKKEGDDIKNETYKLSINGAFGNMAQEHSWLYDVKALLSITINGQLMLSMLCEKLMLEGIELIDVNTDGIYVKLHNSKREQFDKILKEWQDLTKMPLEETKFKSIYFTTTADYFGEYYDFDKKLQKQVIKIKEKGSYITETRLGKGMEFPIIYDAVKKHFLEGISFEKTIKEETDILKFCSYKKLQKKYECFWKGERQQRVNRYYASRSGAHLYRRKWVDKKQASQTEHLLKESPVILMNKLTDLPINQRNINYPFYLAKARQIVENLDSKKGQTSLF